MTNNKISNLIKVVAVLALLCGLSARPQAAHGDDGHTAIGFTLGTQMMTKVREVCDEWLQRGGAGYVCDRAALVGGIHLRVGLDPHRSLMLGYRISDEYEQTFMYASSRPPNTRPYSFQSRSIAYQHRFPLGASDTKGFLKVGFHFTEFEIDDNEVGEYTRNQDGVLLGAGLVYRENLIFGYEFSELEDNTNDTNGHAVYMGVEFTL